MFVNDILDGDSRNLSQSQTTHQTDLHVKDLLVRSHTQPDRLVNWMYADSSPILRVNSAGILAKVGDTGLSDQVVRQLRTDPTMRERYLVAVIRRVTTASERLAVEVRNQRDVGARWCCAFLLGQMGEQAALDDALMLEECPEMRRTFGYALSGRNMAC